MLAGEQSLAPNAKVHYRSRPETYRIRPTAVRNITAFATGTRVVVQSIPWARFQSTRTQRPQAWTREVQSPAVRRFWSWFAGLAEWFRHQPSKLVTWVRFPWPAPFIAVSASLDRAFGEGRASGADTAMSAWRAQRACESWFVFLEASRCSKGSRP